MAAAAEVGNRSAKEARSHSSGRTAAVTEQSGYQPNSSQPRSQQPDSGLAVQQSNSLPSTPYVGARDYNGQFRTPSPVSGTTQPSSPRTARSESDGMRPPGRTLLAGCKYETGIMHFKRRMPYSLGSDKLESSPTKVKKHLEPEEEKRLTADMRELFDRLQPTKESEEKRARFVTKLDTILNEQWPGNDIQVHVFGSSGNSLFTNDSDVDICITTKSDVLQRTCLLAKALGEHGMENIECRPNAKVPIVKMWDPELKLACDMNVNNTAALNNTRMMKVYVQQDPRVRPLAMIIKYWTRRRVLNDAALGGTLSSYTWLCMIVNFLQCRHPKILPALQKPPFFTPTSNGSAGYNEAPDTKDFGKMNRESLGDLLFAFFRKYAHEVDYERFIISVREGGLISKQEKRWHPSQNTRLCVEEPFNLSRNLGNTADDTSFRGVHLELRRAFDLISQGKLEECCKEYVFPANEERTGRNQHIFTKPVSQPRPVLTRSQSQTGSNRTPRPSSDPKKNGHVGQKQRTGSSNRRASSAVPHKLSVHPVTFFDLASTGPQLHESLAHEYQKLQRQEQHLRMKMQGSNNFPARILMSGNGTGYYVEPHAQSVDEPHRRHSMASRTSQHVSVPQFTPLTNVPGIANFLPPGFLSNQSTSPQTTTTPSSPSLSHVQPRYRADKRRSATADAGSYNGARSHSQPPANNPTGYGQAVYMYPETYIYSERQAFPPSHRTLQDIQNDYLARQHRFSNDDGNLSVSSAKFSSIDSPSLGSEIDCASAPDERISRDGMSTESRQVRGGRFPGVHHNEDVIHDHQYRQIESAKPLPSRPRSNSLLSAHGISFFAVEPSDSPPERYGLPVQVPDFPTPQARGITPDTDRLGMVDGNDFFEYPTSPEYPSDYMASRLSYSIASTTTPTSSVGTPSQEQSEPFTVDGSSDRTPAQKLPAAIQFGQFPARAPYRSGQQSRPDDVRGGSVLHGPVRGHYSQTLNGLGINLANDLNDSGLANGGTAMKQSSTVAGLNLASTLKPGSILSPVREVRTPSPTATRGGSMMTYPQPSTVLEQAAMNNTNGFSSILAATSTENYAKKHNRARSVESVRMQLNKQPQASSPIVKASISQKGESSRSTPTKNVDSFGKGGPQHSQPATPSGSQAGVAQSGWQQSANGKKKKNHGSKKSASVGAVPMPIDLSERKGG